MNYYSTLHLFSGLFFTTTLVSQHQKGKPFWILMKQEMGWEWHQLDYMQIICTSLQTDNHVSTSPLKCLSCCPTNRYEVQLIFLTSQRSEVVNALVLLYMASYHMYMCTCVGNVSNTCTILGYEPPRFLSYTCDNWLTQPRIEIELTINEDNPRYPTSVFWREFSRRRSYFFNVSLVHSAQIS